MTDKQKLKRLIEAYDEILYMAIRYANGRHTAAPGMVRRSVAIRAEIDANFTLMPDDTLKEDKNMALQGEEFLDTQSGFKWPKSDWLIDLADQYSERAAKARKLRKLIKRKKKNARHNIHRQ